MTTSAVSIEKETVISERPHTFLRQTDGEDNGSIRSRFQSMILEMQESVCGALEALDGAGKFKEDAWTRPGGGGGISRVLQDGAVFEKAGVNISVVYGVMPPEAYRAAKASAAGQKSGPVPFFAAGISSILHPKNPFAPTLHFNYRYFETDAPKDTPGAPRQWWFGGGTDLTPAYIFEEDIKHFHSDGGGVIWGGNFVIFSNISSLRECADSVVPAYIPILEKRKDTPFNESHKAWQQLRRGRYVEFNLTGGRIESILMSLPLTARWEYDHKPEEGSEEWKLLDACMNPKEWI
ncbi:hypothetical protein GOBAR_DD08487 [Gossypium barbadense]|nr:hypothetical protein GOBAR_DD08487 [Gossypium barbadense]